MCGRIFARVYAENSGNVGQNIAIKHRLINGRRIGFWWALGKRQIKQLIALEIRMCDQIKVSTLTLDIGAWAAAQGTALVAIQMNLLNGA
jgi:hypothetical protein